MKLLQISYLSRAGHEHVTILDPEETTIVINREKKIITTFGDDILSLRRIQYDVLIGMVEIEV